MQTKPLFVTGIGTGIGKTIVSAVLCEQLKADYWKPIQAGDLHFTDSDQVKQLISNPVTKIHPEAFRLQMPASPHQSAKAEQIEIRREDFILPETDNRLLIEGAGGVFVPISNTFFMIDLIKQLEAEVILVSRNYLGCINHTLMSIEVLRQNQIPLKHLVLNGDFQDDTKDILLQQLPVGTSWSQLPDFILLDQESITSAPNQILNF
ncbi:dethiobiotin synthase [Pedobacter sp. L105]|uniref:dethiobiotin synthase n=1 Tax=Pedobacter sp. L105 TaxID=1641871 RepID=UPI00131E7A36|nr:dethiobiotin synthase [Pedobacter sp. L105]